MRYTDFIKPMLAKAGAKPFDHPDWLFEVKYDGYRAIAEVDGSHVKLYSRNGINLAGEHPGLCAALSAMNLHAVLDGEIVALDSNGNSSLPKLQQAQYDAGIPVVFYAFDLLQIDGKPLVDLPLLERKTQLEQLLGKHEVIRYSGHVLHNGSGLFRQIVKANQEGMIAKKTDSTYEEGKRSKEWVKVKYHNVQEAVICGYTEPRGGRKHFGSLVLGVYDKGKLKYVGHAGSGFNEAVRSELFGAMQDMRTGHSPFTEQIQVNAPVTWVMPELVSAIKYTEWTSDGFMRYPVFMGLRKDKSANEVVREQP